MAKNWRISYEPLLTPGGNNDWILQEYDEELNTYIFEPLRRNMVAGIIPQEDFREMIRQIGDERALLWIKAYKTTWWQKIIKWSFYG